MADANVQTGKKARKKLPSIKRFFSSKDALDKAQNEAKSLGYKLRRVRKFLISNASNSTQHFVLAGSLKDAYGRAGQYKMLNGWSATELDPVSSSAEPVTAETLLSAMSLLSDADREKIRQALAKSKK